MSSLSCITITTLILVSLANLVLLVMVILESKRGCAENPFELTEKLRKYPEKRLRLSLLESKNQFMGALYVTKYDRIVLMCGTTIISKFWVVTTAHCCKTVSNYNLDQLQISSNSPQWKSGQPHAVDRIIVHENYTPSTISHNFCLIRVKTPFGGQTLEAAVVLASSKYRYVANSTAITTGWLSQLEENQMDHLYTIDVTLVAYEACKRQHKSRIDETMVCGRNNNPQNKCNFDSGGPLLQKNIVIGIVSFETDCASGEYPRVYTRVAYFEGWIKKLEKQSKLKIGAKFKA